MADDPNDRRWSDFMFTLDVIVAAALAREDAANAATARSPSFTFKLLAAADTEVPAFPSGGLRDTQQLLSATLNETAGELRLGLQAIGYAAMTRVAGRSARVVSADGEIEVGFRFDAGAHGIAVLADTPAVRRALADFTVVLD
jgi:hypothetical protein